jgi:UDP-2,4-diacetamido-2,4,6-trideoxy-beta-L-altropyranose hydrolase
VHQVLFRCDASPEVGSGHVMRCLSLAAKLAELPEMYPVFATNEGGAEVVAKFGAMSFPVIHVSEDLPELIKLRASLGNVRPDYMVWDSYRILPEEEREAAEWVPLMIIDDYHLLPRFTCDAILNQNIYGSQIDYCSENGRTTVLAGLKYTMLRDSFLQYADRKKHVADQAVRLLLTLGGADLHNDTLWFLNWLRDLDTSLDISVVLGAQYKHQVELEAMLETGYPHQVLLHRNVTAMADLMWEADLALTASGSTMYELAFLGIPSCSVVMADNQLPVAEGFSHGGATRYLGRREQLDGGTLRKEVGSLIESVSVRSEMSAAGRRLIDGQGAGRVAQYIERRVKGR